MLINFKQTRFLFLAAIGVLIFVKFLNPSFSFLWFGVAILLYVLLIGLGSAFINSNFYASAICFSTTSAKEIAITFDDGPGPITEEVAAILKEFDVKATFFCIGKKINGNERILQKLHDQGHLIGNHSFSHSYWFDFFPARQVQTELEETSRQIEKVIGQKPLFFRPPYGVTNPSIAKAIKNTGVLTIGWNIRSLDTVLKEKSKVLQRATKNLKGGAIVLFHDTHPRIVPVLKEFLIFVNQNGYKIVNLDELIKKSAYA